MIMPAPRCLARWEYGRVWSRNSRPPSPSPQEGGEPTEVVAPDSSIPAIPGPPQNPSLEMASRNRPQASRGASRPRIRPQSNGITVRPWSQREFCNVHRGSGETFFWDAQGPRPCCVITEILRCCALCATWSVGNGSIRAEYKALKCHVSAY
jgi:hypothetical protein